MGDLGEIGAAAIGGGLGILGTSMTNQANLDAVNATNARMIDMQHETENWEEHMSDTSYQRGMADMRAAGLNPMLAFSQGGASTPGIGMPSLQAPHFENVLGSGVSSALGAYDAANRGEMTGSNIDVNQHVAAAKDAEASQNLTSAVESAKRSQALDLQMAAIGKEAKARGTVAEVTDANAKFDKTLDQVNKGSQVFSNSAGGIADLIGSIGGAVGRGVRGLFQSTPNKPPTGAPPGNVPPNSAKAIDNRNPFNNPFIPGASKYDPNINQRP